MPDDRIEQSEEPGRAETLAELLRIGKDEMNLAEFPLTLLNDRAMAGETSLKFEDSIFDDRKRKLITRKRLIEGSKEYGLPTATDDAVILALIQLTKIKDSLAGIPHASAVGRMRPAGLPFDGIRLQWIHETCRPGPTPARPGTGHGPPGDDGAVQ